MRRPSLHELFGKLKAASAAAERGRIRLVEPIPILVDLSDLDILADDLFELIPKIISEVKPQHYKGKRPPEPSYERAIEGCELYAFRWESRELGCVMYFKFALKDDDLWISSLHPHRSPRREGT